MSDKNSLKDIKCPHCGSTNKYLFYINQYKTKVYWDKTLVNITVVCNGCYSLYTIDLECNNDNAKVGENNGKV